MASAVVAAGLGFVAGAAFIVMMIVWVLGWAIEGEGGRPDYVRDMEGEA